MSFDDFCNSVKFSSVPATELSLTGVPPCAEDLFIRGLVQVAWLILLVYRLLQLRGVPRLPGELTTSPLWLHVIQMVAALCACLVPILSVNALAALNATATYDLVTEPVACVAWLVMLASMHVEYHKYQLGGRWIIPFCWLWHLAGEIARFRSQLLLGQSSSTDATYFWSLFLVGFVANILLVVTGYLFRTSDLALLELVKSHAVRTGTDIDAANALIQQLTSSTSGQRISSTTKVESVAGGTLLRPGEGSSAEAVPRAAHPRETASCVSRLLFWWMGDLIFKGVRQPLQHADIPSLPESKSARVSGARFDANWQKELEEAEVTGKDPSLLRAVRRTFGWAFATAGLFLAVQNGAQYISPILLRLLIGFVQDSTLPNPPADWHGYLYTLGQFGAIMVMMLAENQYFEIVTHGVGIPLRAAMTQAVYRKAIALSPEARAKVANLNTLISSDIDKLELCAQSLHNLWSGPVRIAVGMGLLFDGLGIGVLAGVLLVLLALPVQTRVMQLVARLTKQGLKKSDARIKATSEAISGIRLVKFLGWEEAFLQQILGLREAELELVRKSAYARAISLLFIGLNPVLLSIGTFGAFTIIGGQLTPATAFYALSLLNLLFWPLLLLPRSVATVLETRVSFERLSKFMVAEEVKPAFSEDGVVTGEIKLERVTFRHGGASGAPAVREAEFHIRPGSLVAIVGTTGSGKSSLVEGLLGSLHTVNGTVRRQGSVAYAPQQAWIFGATLRSNVVFCSVDSETTFRDTVRVCGLEPDLAKLPGGEETELGANGINLSGGQQQRVNLARAVYSAIADDKAIVVMDDPLSALDAHVGEFVFDECICKRLAGRTRVLVTNAVHVLPRVDDIIVLEGGRVVQQGSYDALRAEGGVFGSMIASEVDGEGAADEEGAPGATAAAAAGGASVAAAVAAVAVAPTTTPKPEGGGAGEEGGAAAAGVRSGAVGEPADKDAPAAAAKKQGSRLTADEKRAVGGISWSVYAAFIRAAGGTWFMVAIVAALALGEAARTGSSAWLSVWSANGAGLDNGGYMGIFFALSLMQSITTVIISIMAASGGVRASRALHADLVESLVGATTGFHDSQPLGRIVNRFSRDIATIDSQLITNVQLFLSSVVRLLGTVVVVAVSSAYILSAIAPAGIAFYLLQGAFRKTSRELKRLDAVSRSPVYSQFTESMAGIGVIRAFAVQEHMSDSAALKLDRNLNVYDASMAANRWLSIRLEFLGGIVVLGAGVFAVLGRQSIGPEIVGLALSYAASVSANLMMLTRMLTLAENSFNSVERCLEFSDVPQEAPRRVPGASPPPGWPSKGEIEFRDAAMRYRPDLPASVSEFSAIIRPGEKVGVVGRTGAGKSSSFQMLYRIVEPFRGSIHIDGVDISTIGLHDLRQRALSIIPQAPTLFAGALRYNLDPFAESTDEQMWVALEKAQLRALVEEHGGLDMPISEGGTNLSTGQRQLVCLARALLRSTQILVCDEISANLDNRSDAMLQATIRAEFKSATILTIAHRLLSIIDCDRILVLDKGRIVEFDSPQALIESGGEFSSLVEDTGPDMAALLKGIADGSRSLQEVYDTALAEEAPAEGDDEACRPGTLGRDGPRQRQARLAAATLVQAIAQRRDAIWQDELHQTGTPDHVWRQRLFGLVREVAVTAQRSAIREKVPLSSLGFSVSGLAGAPTLDAAAAAEFGVSTAAQVFTGGVGLGDGVVDAVAGDALVLGGAGAMAALGDHDEPLRTRASSTGGADDLGEAAATMSDVLIDAGESEPTQS